MANKGRKSWASPPSQFISTNEDSKRPETAIKTENPQFSAGNALISPTSLHEISYLLSAVDMPPLPSPITPSILQNYLQMTLRKLRKTQESYAELTQRMQELASKYKELMQSAEEMNSRLGKMKSGSREYREIEGMLGTKGKETVEVVGRMKSAVERLPRVERFVREVSLAVFPEWEDSPPSSQLSMLDSIVPTILSYQSSLQSHSLFHRQLTQSLRLPSDSPFESLVSRVLRDTEAVTKFMQLFDVHDRDMVMEELETVFMQMRQAGMFVKDAATRLRLPTPDPDLVYPSLLHFLVSKPK